MKLYSATRENEDRLVVTVDQKLLDPRFDIWTHAVMFDCGHAGEAAAQLSLALLADCLQNDDLAKIYYQRFKWQIIFHLPHNGWCLPEQQIIAIITQFSQND